MTAWLLALLAGALFAAVQYGRLVRREGAGVLPLALLRLAAIALLVALLMDARVGPDRLPAPLVALDASESWTRGDTTRWPRAVADARRRGGDSLLVFGDSVRLAPEELLPADAGSSIGSVGEQAAAQGRPVLIVSDGESVIPASGLESLPRGSRVEVIEATPQVDLAIASVDAPRAIASGDTLRARVTLRGGGRPTPPARLALAFQGSVVATTSVPALEAFAEHAVDLQFRTPAGDGPRLLRAIVAADGDGERRNDTLSVAVDVSPAAGAIWISSAPDLDSRAALGVLRGLGVPTRGFLRVAPVSEAEVLAATREAPLLVIHGDTAVFGPPRALAGDAPLALLPGPQRDQPATPAAGALDEWYPSSAPPSPASSALTGVPWDSLPPVALGPAGPRPAPQGAGAWVAVEGRRARRGNAAPFVVGTESPRRVVVSRATEMWRWQARGGPGAIAYQGLWGSVFDWLADARRDRRAAVPEAQSVRAGLPIRWRLAAARDSATRVVLTRRGAPARVDTLMLTAAPGTIFATSAPLAPGIYDVRAAGGESILPVNAADELLPRAPGLRTGEYGHGPVASTAPALRDYGLAYAAIVLLLCIEWVLRRRRGLR